VISRVWLAAAATVLLAAANAGCQRPTCRILTDLPEPPTGLGPQEDVAPCPAFGPAATDGLTPLTAAPPSPPPPCDALESLWVPDVREVAWRYIVIHHSATDNGNAASFDRLHRLVRHWDELGYHFVIGNGNGCADGAVEIGPRWFKQKWGAHCGGTPNNEYNEFGIGICLVGDFRQHMPTDGQLAAVLRLTRYLTKRYHIPPERIIGHRQAPGASTECPGDRLQAYVLTTLRKEIARDQSE
jgi:hypothetical protein